MSKLYLYAYSQFGDIVFCCKINGEMILSNDPLTASTHSKSPPWIRDEWPMEQTGLLPDYDRSVTMTTMHGKKGPHEYGSKTMRHFCSLDDFHHLSVKFTLYARACNDHHSRFQLFPNISHCQLGSLSSGTLAVMLTPLRC